MQKEFIEQIEQSSKNDIKEKKEQIKNIAEEANKYIITNTRLVEEIDDLERVNVWTPDTLKKLTSLRTKIQTKRETVNEELYSSMIIRYALLALRALKKSLG